MDLKAYLRIKINTYFNPLVIKSKCEYCGATEQLEVHHEYQFIFMLTDVLNELGLQLKDTDEYTELELLNIKEKMLGKHLAYRYKTLCTDCHLIETIKQNKKYNRKTIKDLHDIDDKWLNRPLTTDDKNELCNYLQIPDALGRILKWNGVKEGLKGSGYDIKDKRIKVDGKQIRVSIISKND